MSRKILIVLLSVAIAFVMDAQTRTAERGKVNNGYNFWLSIPKGATNKPDNKKPLILFLHGASLCGSDMNKVLRYGPLAAIDKGLDVDAIFVAPQNPGGAWNPQKVMNIVDHVISQRNDVDTSRLYVLGMSLGGYGTIDVAATYPDRFAAALSMCGGGGVKNLGRLNEIPLWIIHGIADRAVGVGESDKVVKAMKAADPKTPRLVYDRVPGMNHSDPARVFYMPDTYEWLFSHSLSDNDRAISKTFPMSLSTIKDAYRKIKSKKVSLNSNEDTRKLSLERNEKTDEEASSDMSLYRPVKFGHANTVPLIHLQNHKTCQLGQLIYKPTPMILKQ